MHQRLRIVQNGQRREWPKSEPLRHGAEGNEQTLRYAAAMVREDSSQDDRIRSLAEQLVSGCAPRDGACEVRQLFEFARDGIRYLEDPPDTERIADAWRTYGKRSGDCVDKCILLATLLGSIGYRSEFIAQSWDGDLENGFDHVRLRVYLQDGGAVDLDPTNERAAVGWTAQSELMGSFPIWSDAESQNMGGFDFGGLISTGISTGIQYGAGLAQSRMQQSRASSEQNAAIEAEWDQLIAEALAIFQSLSAKPNVTVEDGDYAAAVIAAIEQWLGQNGTARVRQQWNDPDYKPAFTHSLNVLRNRAAQQSAGGTGPPANAGGSDSWLNNPYVPIALVIAAALLLKGRLQE